jgi:hypothetical protein
MHTEAEVVEELFLHGTGSDGGAEKPNQSGCVAKHLETIVFTSFYHLFTSFYHEL